MPNAYVIVKGEYDEFGIILVSLSKERADKMCALLNANPWNGAHTVYEYPLDALLSYEAKVLGYRADYTYFADGINGRVAVKEAYYDPYNDGKAEFYEGKMVAFADTRDECVSILLAAVEEKKRIDAIQKSQGHD